MRSTIELVGNSIKPLVTLNILKKHHLSTFNNESNSFTQKQRRIQTKGSYSDLILLTIGCAQESKIRVAARQNLQETFCESIIRRIIINYSIE